MRVRSVGRGRNSNQLNQFWQRFQSRTGTEANPRCPGFFASEASTRGLRSRDLLSVQGGQRSTSRERRPRRAKSRQGRWLIKWLSCSRLPAYGPLIYVPSETCVGNSSRSGRMYSSSTPQQPPMICTPCATHVLVLLRNSSGVSRVGTLRSRYVST